MKKISKFKLKKEVVSVLSSKNMSELKGQCNGATTTICGNSGTQSITCFTVGSCDIYSISDPGCNWQTEAWYCVGCK